MLTDAVLTRVSVDATRRYVEQRLKVNEAQLPGTLRKQLRASTSMPMDGEASF